MKRSLALTALLVLVAAGAAYAGGNGGFDGPTIAQPVRVPDFALRDQNGRLVRLSGQRGHAVLLTFLYTHCPDECPLTASYLDQAAIRIPGVRILAVSVDPRGDTITAVRRFIRNRGLHAEFHYLVGPTAALKRVWAAYHVTATVKVGARTVSSHTLYTLLIDQKGRDRVLYGAASTTTAVAHDLRLILASGS